MKAQRILGAKLITAILPKGKGMEVMTALKHEKDVVTANLNFARGTGRMTHRAYRTRMTETEKEVLTVVVTADRQEEIFEFIHEIAGIGAPHGGLLYQTELSATNPFSLPDLPEED